MRAISLKQPFAYFVAKGLKPLETRTFRTQPGELLICSSKTIHTGKCMFPYFDRHGTIQVKPRLFDCKEVYRRLQERCDGDPDLELGKALALTAVRTVEPLRNEFFMLREACCGWYEGAWAWRLEQPHPIHPFDIRGRPGFYNVEDHLIKLY